MEVLMLLPKQFDRLLALKKRPVVTIPCETMLGTADLRTMRWPAFELAGLHYKDILFGENKAACGIGMEFFQRHLTNIHLFPTVNST